MEHRTIDELERDLRADDGTPTAPPDLAAIRSRGVRRRAVRGVLAGGAAAACVGAVGLASLTVTGVVGGPERPEPGVTTQAKDVPRELSPLARRVLEEVPGARQVSPWQVVVPPPAGTGRHQGMDQVVPEELIAGGPVDVGARSYTGVTAFQRGQFPAWLYDRVEQIERTELGSEEEGYPVGSTEMGIIVDAGPLDLACVAPLPEWVEGDPGLADDGCSPAMLGAVGGDRTYRWGMGTDDFLEEGEELELFSTDVYTDGTPRTVWIGGTHGTDVAAVELVGVDGTRVEATVAAGTLVPGETMFWGTVTGELALAVTRDADGDVLERHELEPCGDPVECEVR